MHNVNDKINNSMEEKTSNYHVDRKLDGGLQRATGKPAGSVFIFKFAVANFTMANESHGIPHHLLYGGDFGLLERIPEHRRSVYTGHPLTRHICVVQFVHSAYRTSNALGSRIAVSSLRTQSKCCHLVCNMSHPWLFSHAPSSRSTSSSSPTCPTTQREHSAHPAHLQAPSVDKLRHQQSLWREDLQSGGTLRTTISTGYELKELATVSRTDAYSGDPYQLYDVQENFWRRRSPSSYHRQSEGIWRNWETRLVGF